MANSTSILDYLGRGTHAARPASPPIAPDALAAYYETDTGDTFVWSGSAWVQVNSAGGSSTLSGDTDVSISSPSDGEVLTYHSATSKWINAAASGGSGSASSIAFNSAVAGNTYNPNGGTATDYFQSTADITVPTAPFVFRLRHMAKISSTSVGYVGVMVGDTAGGKTVFVGIQITGGYAIAYYAPLSGSGQLFNNYQAQGLSAVGSFALFEMVLSVSNSTHLIACASYSGGGDFVTAGISDIDLTAGIRAYAVGAASTDIIACQYEILTASSSNLFA